MAANTKHTLEELGDFLDPILSVPSRGKKYLVPAVDAATGLRMQKLIATGVKASQGIEPSEKDLELLSDEEETDFFATVLGNTYQELLDDGAPYAAVKHISTLALLWTTQSFEAAQSFFDMGGKTPQPNRADRRKTATRTSTGADATTP